MKIGNSLSFRTGRKRPVWSWPFNHFQFTSSIFNQSQPNSTLNLLPSILLVWLWIVEQFAGNEGRTSATDLWAIPPFFLDFLEWWLENTKRSEFEASIWFLFPLDCSQEGYSLVTNSRSTVCNSAQTVECGRKFRNLEGMGWLVTCFFIVGLYNFE